MNGTIRDLALSFIKKSKMLRRLNNLRLQKSFAQYIIAEQEIHAAEINGEEKKRFVEKYMAKWPSLAMRFQKGIDTIISKHDGVVLRNDELITEILFCCFAYGFEPDEFFSYNLKNRDSTERRSFMSDRDTMIMIFKMNDRSDISLFNDKAETFDFYKDYYGRNAIAIKKEEDFHVFESFIKGKEYVVKKAVHEAMGRSVELIDLKDWKGKEKSLFEKLLQQGKTLIEERVVQADCMKEYNSSSVNTVRFITFTTKDGIIVPYAFFKTGRNQSFVDNGGAGGIFIGIDVTTGVTSTDGYDEMGIRYIEHPNSHKPFKGFKMPEWERAIEMSKELSAKVPSIKFVGWDFAYTDEGWIVIEGNGMSQLIGPQSTFQNGIKTEITSIMSQMNLIS